MRSGGNKFNYFPENKLTKLANLVQVKRMLMLCPDDWRGLGPLVYTTESVASIPLPRGCSLRPV